MFSLARCVRPAASVATSVRQFSLLNKPTAFSRPLGSPLARSLVLLEQPQLGSAFQMISSLIQKRFKSRGNTYQPSTFEEKTHIWLFGPVEVEKRQEDLGQKKGQGQMVLDPLSRRPRPFDEHWLMKFPAHSILYIIQ
ncbi:hypothetical protein HF325_004433 [Metschnikowia pulcherrima]|uniref:Uncharacterized protein n=1 Tax=Metschnikowia pulcherrima TaxID=27326 RepID=A0A8H7L9Z9_9ASCO|nr:hypothetical protein HF325_004433 [Metschnikowia pulcherrima]